MRMRTRHLGEAYFKDVQTHFDCREARTVDQAKDLLAKGYEYVIELDGVRLLRKPDLI
jgi:hypothetical protein